MSFDDRFDDDESYRAPPPPDDRVWRHPSEAPAAGRAGRGGRPLWPVAVASGVIGALAAVGLVALLGGFDGKGAEHPAVERVVRPAGRAADAAGDRVVAIAERVRPAIVKVLVSRQRSSATGSGVIFRDDGHLLTNAHVVEGAASVTVVLSDGRKAAGRIVGVDPETDMAVVKIDGDGYATAAMGSATGLKVGQQAIAIGSPLGLAGGPSVSVGVVSALGRRIPRGDDPDLLDMIQTDAPIAPGSSGGALLDGSGSVIGITTAAAVTEVGAEGLGFATPIDIARLVAQELIAHGRAVHVWLGIEGGDLDDARATQLRVGGGASVGKVFSESPAKAAGLTSGDVILSLDGRTVTSMAELVVALRRRHVGDVVTLSYMRGGKPRTASCTLIERPENLSG